MSIQNTIDKHLSDEGRHLRSIVSIEEDGDAILPSNCYLHLRKCNIGSLTIGRNCIVVIEESNLNGTLSSDTDSTITMDRVICASGSSITIRNSKLSQKLCKVLCPMTLDAGSILEAYKNERLEAPISITLKDESKATLRSDTITSVERGVVLEGMSFCSLKDTTIIATVTAIEAKEFSGVDAYSGILIGESEYAIHLLDHSTGKFTAVSKEPIIGLKAAVYLESESEAKFYNTRRLESEQFAVLCEDSKFTIHNYESITSKSNAVKLVNSSFYAYKGKEIVSTDADSVVCKDSIVFVQTIESIKSEPANAFFSSGSTITLKDVSIEVRGYGASAFLSGDSDVVLVEDCPLVRGDGDDCVKTGDDSRFTFIRVKELISDTAAAFTGGDNVILEGRIMDRFIGRNGDAVRLGDNARVEFSRVSDRITSNGTNGIKVGTSSVIRGNDVEKIECTEGSCIVTGEFCDTEFNNTRYISSELGEAIDSISSKFVAKNGTEIKGNQGCGVKLTGSNNECRIEHYSLVQGIEAAGIRLDSGNLYINKITEVRAGGSAFKLLGVKAEIKFIDILSAGDNAVSAKNSVVTLDEIESIEGGSTGLKITNSDITIKNCKSVTGNPDSVVLQGGRLNGFDCSFTSNVRVEDKSKLSLVNCTIELNCAVSESMAQFDNVVIEYTLSAESSSIECNNTEVKEAISLASSSISARSTTTDGAISFFDSGGILVACSAGSYPVATSAVNLLGCEGTVAFATGSVVEQKKTGELTTYANITTVKSTTSVDFLQL